MITIEFQPQSNKLFGYAGDEAEEPCLTLIDADCLEAQPAPATIHEQGGSAVLWEQASF